MTLVLNQKVLVSHWLTDILLNLSWWKIDECPVVHLDGGHVEIPNKILVESFGTSATSAIYDLRPICKSSQVSPNARRQAQCKGGGGKEKNIYTEGCQTLYNLQASVTERRKITTWSRNPGNMANESPIGPHFSQQFPNCPKPCT